MATSQIVGLGVTSPTPTIKTTTTTNSKGRPLKAKALVNVDGRKEKKRDNKVDEGAIEDKRDLPSKLSDKKKPVPVSASKEGTSPIPAGSIDRKDAFSLECDRKHGEVDTANRLEKGTGPIHPGCGLPIMQSGFLPGVSSDRLKLVNMGPIHGPDDHRFSVLSFDQVQRLDEVMNKPIPIHGRGNFPTLEVRLKDFVSVVRTKLAKHGLHVRDIRLNGGAASYVLLSPDEYDPDADNDNDADSYYNPSPPSPLPSSEVAGLGREITRSPFSLSSQHSTSSSTSTSGVSTMTSSSSSASSSASSTSGASPHPYNDVDLIFAVDLSQQRNFDKVKTATLEALADFFPLNDKRERDRMSVCSMKEGYVHKLVKVTNGEGGDRWSLISLSRVRGRNVELKFVDSMKRQFQFSVDSFQILLDSLLLFYECAEMPMSSNFYPTVVGESMFGDFGESMCHLQEKLIATHCPEEIRGGGLLKYCNLIVRGYRAAEAAKIKTLERYMCSRFFIDFPDLQLQRTKLERYLWDHFSDEDEELTPALRYQYLMTLHRVVDESTVCLMSHERKSTLFLIEELAFEHRPANELGYSAFSCYPNQPYYPNYHHHSSKHHQYHHQHQYDNYYQHQQQQYYYPSGFVLIPNSWMSCA